MSYYPDLDNYNENDKEKIIKDLSLKKEFYIYGQQLNIYKNNEIDNMIIKSKKLILNSYQTFVQNFLNINTNYTRLLLVHTPGSGKTITSLKIAYNFMNYYNKMDKELGNILIIGFTKNIFKRELLRPEFGIITQDELNELIKVKQLVSQNNLQIDIEYFKELRNRYNRRITKKNIKFYGYKEFVGKLLILTDLDENIKLTDLKENEILKYLKEKKIKLNEEILLSFKNSLLICDEIHNVYNSLAPNNWGIVLQIVLDYHSQYGNTLRTLFLSATPINNNYTEIVNMINLLSNYNKKINKNNIFDKNNNFLDNSLDKIKNLLINKISYIKDINKHLYPSSNFIGNEIKGISYLKFIQCPMSKLHFNTYKNISKDKGKLPLTLSLEHIYINDYVIPNPDDINIGLYKSIDINDKIRNSSQKWKEENKIKFISKSDGMSNYELSGNFMLEKNIREYSEKYYQMLKLINNMIINKEGKIFIYHNFVNNSGVIFIQEILKINGYLDKNSSSTLNTKCTFCAKIRKDHENNNLNHDFKPVRFIIINSEIQRNIIENDIDMYNLGNNTSGENIKIILGSRAIKESFDLKAIRNVIITSCPDNISTLIQIIGRSIRKNSHINLPEKEKHVNIYILVNSISNSKELSYEELKYKNKIEVYKEIQKIENIFINNSIDSLVNQNIYNTQLNDELFPNNNKRKDKIELDSNKLNLSTFVPYHIKTEIENVKYIIKRLFLEISNIWDYNKLYKYVKKPPFNIEFNTNHISEQSFIVALNFLVYKRDNVELLNDSTQNLITNLFDSDSKIIIDINNRRKIILYINKYYILAPYSEDSLIYLNVDDPFREQTIIKKKKIILNKYIHETNIHNNYEQIKEFIIEKYYNYEFKNLINFLDEYNIDFHIQFIKELIEYFYNIYTNKKYIIKNINHDFYLKMLYYYNKFNLIIFSDKLDEYSFKIYKNSVLINTKIDTNNKISNIIISSLEEELIKSSPDKNEIDNLSNQKLSIYKHAKLSSNTFLNNKKNKFIKIDDYLLPVGYSIDEIPKLYTIDSQWFDNEIYYTKNIQYIENNIIIGYSTKDKTSIESKFKLRPPKLNQKDEKDTRKIFTGIICTTKDKSELLQILYKLNPTINISKISKNILCNLIKRELIIRELKERKLGSNIKWYYNIFESFE